MDSIAQVFPNGAIYFIQSIVSGGVYVGMTTAGAIKRWSWHRCELNANRHPNPHLQRSWNKYGASAFEFVVIEEYTNLDELNEAEIFWIGYLRYCGVSLYNAKSGGGYGGQHSTEMRYKASIAHTGKFPNEKTRRKISEGLRGKKKQFSPEAQARMRTKQWATGRKHTEEHKRKISEAGRGRVWSEATREKRKGLRHSEETKARMSAAQKDRTFTDEARSKMRAAWQQRNTYVLHDPSGVEHITHDLQSFCQEHGLSVHSIRDVAKGRRESIRGWRCKYKRDEST